MTDAEIVQEWLVEGKGARLWSAAPRVVLAALGRMKDELDEAKRQTSGQRVVEAEAERNRLFKQLSYIATEYECSCETPGTNFDCESCTARAALGGFGERHGDRESSADRWRNHLRRQRDLMSGRAEYGWVPVARFNELYDTLLKIRASPATQHDMRQ
jgi:hypothetical protein